MFTDSYPRPLGRLPLWTHAASMLACEDTFLEARHKNKDYCPTKRDIVHTRRYMTAVYDGGICAVREAFSFPEGGIPPDFRPWDSKSRIWMWHAFASGFLYRLLQFISIKYIQSTMACLDKGRVHPMGSKTKLLIRQTALGCSSLRA